MHTLSACGYTPQFLSLAGFAGRRKPGHPAVGAETAAPAFGSVNFALAQAEVVPHFVPDGVGDDMLQVPPVARHLLVRVLVDIDPVSGQPALQIP